LSRPGGRAEDYPFWLVTARSMQYAWGGNVGMQLIKEVAVQPGRAVIVVTHDSRVYDFGDRIGILWSEGTLRAGSTDTAATYSNTRLEKQVRHRQQINEIKTVTSTIEIQGDRYPEAMLRRSGL